MRADNFLITEQALISNAITEAINPSVVLLAEAIQRINTTAIAWNRFVLSEELTRDEIKSIFKSLATTRGEADVGLGVKTTATAKLMGANAKAMMAKAKELASQAKSVSGEAKDKLMQQSTELVAKAKDASSKVATKGKGLAGKFSSGTDNFRLLVSMAVAKASKDIPRGVESAIAAGGEASHKAHKIIDNAIDDAIVSIKSEIRRKMPHGEKIVSGAFSTHVDELMDAIKHELLKPSSQDVNESYAVVTDGNVVSDLSRIMELAGLTEGPKLDALKKGAKKLGRGVKDIAQGAKQSWQGKSALSVDDLNDKWQEAGSPTDEKQFQEFLKGLGVTDREIRTAMSAVPGAAPDIDQKQEVKLQKLANAIKKLGMQNDIRAYIETSLVESLNEEIEHPEVQLDDKTVLAIFQSLEKVLPQLKVEPEAEEEPAELDQVPDTWQATGTDPKTGKPKYKVLNQSVVYDVIKKLVEQHLYGRPRR